MKRPAWVDALAELSIGSLGLLVGDDPIWRALGVLCTLDLAGGLLNARAGFRLAELGGGVRKKGHILLLVSALYWATPHIPGGVPWGAGVGGVLVAHELLSVIGHAIAGGLRVPPGVREWFERARQQENEGAANGQAAAQARD